MRNHTFLYLAGMTFAAFFLAEVCLFPGSAAAGNANVVRDETAAAPNINSPSTTRSKSVKIKGSVSTNTVSVSPGVNGRRGSSNARHVPPRAKDKVGKTTKKATKVTFSRDKTPPVIIVGGIKQGGVYRLGVKPEIKITDTQSLVTERILLDGKPFVPGTAVISEGKHYLKIEAVDSHNNTASRTVNFKIARPKFPKPAWANRPPVLKAMANITVNETDTINLDPQASDPDKDPLTFSYSGWMTSSSYTAGYRDAGSHIVTVKVSDGEATDEQDVTIVVRDINLPSVMWEAEIRPAQETVVAMAVCGNGSQEAGESCDSNTRGCATTTGYTGTQSCNVQCAGFNACVSDLFCGDVICTNPPETTTSCPSDCPAICGNGIAEPSEQCDDHNKTSGDGCSAACTLEICGDGVVQTGLAEACEGNGMKGCLVGGYAGVRSCAADACTYGACTLVESCGDGTKNGPEVCDEGTSNGTPNHCNAQCSGTTTAVCGNNIEEGPEGCDDGNKTSGDGCSSACKIEFCGDGTVQAGLKETCEGNSVKSCVAGGYAGIQSCAANCTYSACAPSEFCGDGFRQTAA